MVRARVAYCEIGPRRAAKSSLGRVEFCVGFGIIHEELAGKEALGLESVGETVHFVDVRLRSDSVKHSERATSEGKESDSEDGA